MSLHENEAFFRSVGGSIAAQTGDPTSPDSPRLMWAEPPIWFFGYYAEPMRDTVLQMQASTINRNAPVFSLPSRAGADTQAFLWECTKKINGGQHFTNQRQESGSCVGINGGQAAAYTGACDVAIRGDWENALDWPFWLLPYGVSRQIMGARGQGSGSTGGSMAQAVREAGFPPFSFEGLPKPGTSDGIGFGERTEIAWSYAPQQPKGPWQEAAKKHPMQTTARCRNSDDVREALRNGYACTQASMWGGDMKPSVTEGVLLNRRSDRWSHQMCIVGWQDHPKLGEIFYILNSWGPRTHGEDPAGGPPGGFWVKKEEVNFMCADEVYAYSGWQGFELRDPYYV